MSILDCSVDDVIDQDGVLNQKPLYGKRVTSRITNRNGKKQVLQLSKVGSPSNKQTWLAWDH